MSKGHRVPATDGAARGGGGEQGGAGRVLGPEVNLGAAYQEVDPSRFDSEGSEDAPGFERVVAPVAPESDAGPSITQRHPVLMIRRSQPFSPVTSRSKPVSTRSPLRRTLNCNWRPVRFQHIPMVDILKTLVTPATCWMRTSIRHCPRTGPVR